MGHDYSCEEGIRQKVKSPWACLFLKPCVLSVCAKQEEGRGQKREAVFVVYGKRGNHMFVVTGHVVL